MPKKYDFHYTPTGTGVISGREVLTQTEDAINALGTYSVESREMIDGAVAAAQEATASANAAAATAADASEAARKAAQDATDAADSIAGFNDRLTAAENNASSALTTANSAKTTANQAKTTATQAKTAADAAQAAATQAQDSAAASAQAAKASADEANESADLAMRWATATDSPDGAEDAGSPTGQTQSSRSWALQAKETVDGIEGVVDAAVQTVDNARDSGLNAVQSAQETAVSEVSTAKTDAVGAVNTARDNAISAIGAASSNLVTLSTAQTISGEKTFSASPLVPTAEAGDNSTKAASTAFVQAAVAAGGSVKITTISDTWLANASSHDVANEAIGPGSLILMGLPKTASADDYAALGGAMIVCTAQGTGTATLTALGTAPTIAVPFELSIVGE